MTKQVKIIGLSINKNFGGLKANNLKFDEDNKLILIKGGVGSGKTTLNKAMRLCTQGSGVLQDKNLYGEVDLTATLKDGKKEIFIDAKTMKDGSIGYVLYTKKDGKKVRDVVIDGQKLTPANYLKSLQTALTWRLDELTSENPVTQRKILLELYKDELENEGVIYNKSHPDYVGSILDKIEKAKNLRSHKDALRKEVGGIADDLTKKGVNFENRRELIKLDAYEKAVGKLQAKIILAKEDVGQSKESALNKLKATGSELNIQLHLINDKIKAHNRKVNIKINSFREIDAALIALGLDENQKKMIIDKIKTQVPDLEVTKNELRFSGKGTCKSKPKHFTGEIRDVLKRYKDIQARYILTKDSDGDIDTSELEDDLKLAKLDLLDKQYYNDEADSINSFHEWRDADQAVKSLNTDYYKKLTNIETGVKGLHIQPEDDDIYLMYDGSYDKKYFSNPDKQLRKLSSYSGTQRPMVCLLIQQHLLSKKEKTLPYLWIDDVPFDDKTINLINKMAIELGLWLFVNWTGTFSAKGLKPGEVLVENGELFFKE